MIIVIIGECLEVFCYSHAIFYELFAWDFALDSKTAQVFEAVVAVANFAAFHDFFNPVVVNALMAIVKPAWFSIDDSALIPVRVFFSCFSKGESAFYSGFHPVFFVHELVHVLGGDFPADLER